VVKTTTFGAFVNLVPGRDGLVHISKLGGGKRINAVEDVLELGQEIEVRVEEIDDKGKVSLTPAGDPPPAKEGSSSNGGGESSSSERRERAPRKERSNDSETAPAASGGGVDVVEVSFEDSFDAQLADELGDLGPKSERPSGDGGGRSGGRRRHR
jgi:polyribonucleotide nucleotidyltransferase